MFLRIGENQNRIICHLLKCVGALVDALRKRVTTVDLQKHINWTPPNAELNPTSQSELLYFSALLLYLSTSPTELFTNNKACVNSPTSVTGSGGI